MALNREELERIADEEMAQYRATLRTNQGRQRATPQAITAGPSPVPKTWGTLAVLAAVGIGVLLFFSVHGKTPAKKILPVPISQQIALGQTIVSARGYISYKIVVPRDMTEAVVSGNFKVSGGSDSDIAAAIAGEGDYNRWLDGQAAEVNWQTAGRTTGGPIDVHLGPGTYYLVFSNKFSALSPKYVQLDVKLNYKRLAGSDASRILQMTGIW